MVGKYPRSIKNNLYILSKETVWRRRLWFSFLCKSYMRRRIDENFKTGKNRRYGKGGKATRRGSRQAQDNGYGHN